MIDVFGHKTPTYVQQCAIPSIKNGLDTLIKSQTGSGKVSQLHL